jgi:hypothetical protein
MTELQNTGSLSWPETCAALQRHNVNDDMDRAMLGTTTVHTVHAVPIGYGRVLGELLGRSEAPVATLVLNVAALWSTSSSNSSSSSSSSSMPDVAKLVLDNRVGETDTTTLDVVRVNDAELQPLHDYVRSSTTLRRLELWSSAVHTTCRIANNERMDVRLWPLLVAAVANPGIDCLVIHAVISAAALAYVVREMRSLSTLFLDPDVFPDPAQDATVLATISNAFGAAHTTLQHVRLVGPEGGPQSCIPLVESIVPHLARHAGLRRLDLGDAASTPFSQPDWALLLFTTRTLEHLSIADYYFDETSFPPFIKALQSNTTVTRLTLSNGRLSSQAGTLLGTFVNRDANRNGNKVSKLELDSIYGNLNVTSMLIGSALSTLILTQTLRNARHRPDTTFTNDLRTTPPNMFRALAQWASQVSLQRLHLAALGQAMVPSLAQYLAVTVTLQELVFTETNTNVDVAWLVTAIGQNGSLVTVQVERENKQTVFNAEQQCKVSAALQRNRCLQDLLGNVNDPAEQDAAVAATAGTALLPCLLRTALQAPRLAPTTLLTGLLALV